MNEAPVELGGGPPGDATSTSSEAWERWVHFADAGGHDKDRMITISTSLLSLAAVVGAIALSDDLDSDPWYLALALGVIGVGLSLLSCYLVVLYGGYSNRNWSRADAIAEEQGWTELQHDDDDQPEPPESSRRLARYAWTKAKPCDPSKDLASVFKVYLAISSIVAALHVVIAGVGIIESA